MSFELMIALRYLLARRKQAFISVISLISVLGVALGVAALIIVIGVMTGFSKNLQDKIFGVSAHLIVSNLQGNFEEYDGARDKAADVPGVAGATPFLYSEVMLSNQGGFKGVVLKGIDPATAGDVLSLPKDMISGSMDGLEMGDVPGIVIGRDLAARLGLVVGARVNVLAPSGKKTAAGFSPEIRPFQVAGVFDSGMIEYDSSLAYAAIPAVQGLLGMEKDMATGLEIRLEDVYSAKEVGSRVQSALGGYPFYVRDWMEMNRNLFSALRLEKTAMFVILIMIVLVGSFSIVTSLVMLVMEKTQDIAILRAMGAGRKSIGRIFTLQGVIIGGLGTLLGLASGVGICLLLQKYPIIKLPADVYFLDRLPILLQWTDLAMICGAAFGLCFLATIYPSRQAAGLKPAEALRYD